MNKLDEELKKYMEVKMNDKDPNMKIILVNFKEVSVDGNDDDLADLMIKRYGEYLKEPGKVSFIIDCRSIKSIDLSLIIRKMPKMLKLNDLAKAKVTTSTVILDETSAIYRTARIIEKQFPFAVRGGIFPNRIEALNFIKRG